MDTEWKTDVGEYMNIEWKEEYNLGIEEIDYQHRIFLSLIKKIEDFINNPESGRSILRLILELKKYAEFHFQSEENTMVDRMFPGIISHKQQHEKLLSSLQLVLFKIEIGEMDLKQLPKFLNSWLVNHTLKEDKKLVTYLNSFK